MKQIIFIILCFMLNINLSWGFDQGDPIGNYNANEHNPFGHALVPDMIADASIQLIGDYQI